MPCSPWTAAAGSTTTPTPGPRPTPHRASFSVATAISATAPLATTPRTGQSTTRNRRGERLQADPVRPEAQAQSQFFFLLRGSQAVTCASSIVCLYRQTARLPEQACPDFSITLASESRTAPGRPRLDLGEPRRTPSGSRRITDEPNAATLRRPRSPGGDRSAAPGLASGQRQWQQHDTATCPDS